MSLKQLAGWVRLEINRKIIPFTTDGKLDYQKGGQQGTLSGGSTPGSGRITEETLYDRHIAPDANISGSKIQKASTTNYGVVQFAELGESTAGEAIQANDPRLIAASGIGPLVDYWTKDELASQAHGLGASVIGIEDAQGYFTGKNVEAALSEAMDAIDTVTITEISLIPEFPGAVLYADSSANAGQMTGHYDSVNRRNSYRWTTTEGTTQDYDVVVQFIVPAAFGSWSGGVKVWSLVSNDSGSTGVRLVAFYDTAGNNVITPSTKQNTSWTEDTYSISAGTWTPGELATLQFRLFADTGETADLGSVYLLSSLGATKSTNKDLTLNILVLKETEKDLTLVINTVYEQTKDLDLLITVPPEAYRDLWFTVIVES